MANLPGARHRRWAALPILAALLWAAAGCGRPPERVVLITIDTLRADHVGVYGASPSPTPILDHVAGQGVRFDTALAPTPLTLPSHASLMTGLTPLEHGVHANASFQLREDLPTLAERLRAAGLATAAFVGAHVLDRNYGLARGFDVYDDRMGGRHAGGASGWAERRADAVVDAALGWLASAPQRFFLWVHLYDPHSLYAPPPAFAARYGSLYAGEIAFADAQLGRLLSSMAERFALDRSLVVVTSDHGESLGEHGERTHGYAIYDATQRVPLVFAGRGIPAGEVVSTPVGLVDVAPTILARLGLDPLPAAVGSDLTPRMRGRSGPVRAVFLETFATRLDLALSPLTGLRTERYKLIRAPTPELYDLSQDPGELRNLAAERPELVAELRGALEQRMAGAEPVEPNRVVSDSTRALLLALGYGVGEEVVESIPVDSLEGADPKDERETLERFHRVAELAQRGLDAEAGLALDDIPDGGFHGSATRAELALNVGDPAAAERYALETIANYPSHSHGHYLLGRSLEAQGRLDGARDSYAASLRHHPESGRILERLAGIAERQGDLAEAARLYGRAADARAPVPASRWRQAALLRQLGRQAEADEAERRARESGTTAPSPTS